MTISRSSKFVSVALVGTLALGTVSVAQAAPHFAPLVSGEVPLVQKVNNGRHGAFIAGALGALALGAIIANQNRNDYPPVDTYDQPVYAPPVAEDEPVYAPPVADEEDLYDAPAPVYEPAPVYRPRHHRYYRYYDGY
jgi:hypothetical protein